VLRERVGDLVKACRGADLLIHNSGINREALAPEILDIPQLKTLVAPERAMEPEAPGLSE
jgi:hypothetical protein